VDTRVVLGLAGVAAAFVAASPGHAANGAPAPAPALLAASALPATHGHGAGGVAGFMPLHAQAYRLAKEAANVRAGVATKGGGRPRGGGGGGPIVSSYANVSPSVNGTYDPSATPPDTTGSIGPDRYVEAVNTQYAIYSRSGSLINSGSLSDLTGIATGLFGYALSDPQVMWDAKTQRFYYSAVYFDSLFFSDNGIAIGWSKTATPSSAADFCQYAIQFGSELPDYPKLGDSSDFLLVGYNQFGNFASTYDGSEFAMVNKPPAGSACAPTSAFAVYASGVLQNADSSQAATPVPANLVDDANGTGYVVANADLSTVPSANFVTVYSVSTNGTDANGIPIPLVGGPISVPVPSYSLPASARQAGSSYLLDTLDGRFEASVAAVDPSHGGVTAVWTAHAVFGGAGSEERWYEINPITASLLQSGVVTSSSSFVWNGAISPDRANNGTSGAFGGDMAMSLSTSSASSYPAIGFVWKKGASAQSALTTLVQAGGASVDLSCSSTTPCRWGDYSGAVPDPAASGTVGKVWLANQYNVSGGTTLSTSWRSWIFAVTPTG
jgi:hypothetical protein